ncbi:hypothetical protein CLOM_g1243 [Closterium sp. NIES-68]|nr:hypothetical protein CLOM_g1243 [Closterium sp. NIES-68]
MISRVRVEGGLGVEWQAVREVEELEETEGPASRWSEKQRRRDAKQEAKQARREELWKATSQGRGGKGSESHGGHSAGG